MSEMDVIAAAFAVSFVLFGVCWGYGITHGRDASATDAYYGLSTLVHGGITLLLWEDVPLRGVVLFVPSAVWSVGLGQFLLRRWVRHHRTGGDARYLLAVEKLQPGRTLWWKTLLSLVVAQSLLVTLLNAPLQLAMMSERPGVRVADVLALLCVTIGGAIEVSANRQLEAFKRRSTSRQSTLMTGLWRWSRHPNYFGNVLVYFGFFLAAIREADHWWTAAAPCLMYGLLRFGTGVRLTDWMMLKKRSDDPVYLDYVARTSPFMLRPPRRRPKLAG